MSYERKARAVPREARALETRERLIEAGRRAFGELGPDGVNLARDVLEPAGVSVGSFYHQFEDKTDLLVVIMREAAALRRASVLGLAEQAGRAETLGAGLHRALGWFFDSMDNDDHAWQLQLQVRMSTDPRVRAEILQLREAWIEPLAAVYATWSAADERTRRLGATMLVGFATGLAVTYFDLVPEDRPRRRPELLETAFTFAQGGLASVLGPLVSVSA